MVVGVATGVVQESLWDSAQLHAESAISHSLSFGYRDKDDNYNITARAVARAVIA